MQTNVFSDIAKIIIASLSLLMTVGCANFDLVTLAAKTQAAASEDRLRDEAAFITCKGISIGSWGRKYGRDPVRAAAWRTDCGYDSLLTTPAQ